MDGGLICATVPGLRGVIATAATVEGCCTELAEVLSVILRQTGITRKDWERA